MDIELHFTECGDGEPLVLLHGNGEDSTYFEHQVPLLAEGIFAPSAFKQRTVASISSESPR